MNVQLARELFAKAELALYNQQYEVALDCYRKALNNAPNDLEILSRYGAVCVAQELYDEAIKSFEHAVSLDSENGDNIFNLGNAYLFKSDFVTAFRYFTEAEHIGCSQDVLLQLYYQLMIMSILRADFASAKVYIQKIEDTDTEGTVALSPAFLSEKIKLYMLNSEYSKAEESARQLVARQPTVYQNYSIYFGLLMAKKDYYHADLILLDAARYAELTKDDEVNIFCLRASMYVAIAESDPTQAEECYQSAINELCPYLGCEGLNQETEDLFYSTLCDVYEKAEQYDCAIMCAAVGLQLPIDENGVPIDVVIQSDFPTEEEAKTIYDPEQEVITDAERYTAGQRLRRNEDISDSEGDETATPVDDSIKLSDSVKEKLYFTLVTSYLGKEDFVHAGKYAAVLKHSNEDHYAYYGRYVETMASRFNGTTPEESQKMYAKTIAFFRNRIMQNHVDNLAALFRARLYAEIGKYNEAEEICRMLTDDDRKKTMEYINEQKAHK